MLSPKNTSAKFKAAKHFIETAYLYSEMIIYSLLTCSTTVSRTFNLLPQQSQNLEQQRKYTFNFTPEMVVAEAMLDAPLELSHVPAAILTGVHAIPMALAVGPLPCIHIPGVEPVDSVAMPEPLAVLAPVPAPPSPGLDAKAVVLAVDPVPLVPPAHVVVVDAAARAAAAVELALVDVAVAVHLDEMAGGRGGRRRGGRGADGPEDRGSARAAERERQREG